MNERIVIYWSRRDFRLTDNPALTAAIRSAQESNAALLSVFVLEDYMRKADPASQWGLPQRIILSRALPRFAERFPDFRVLLGKGAARIIEVATRYNAQVFVNEDVYPDFYTQVQKIRAAGVSITVLPDQMTVHPSLVTGSGNHYSVFTPFKRAAWEIFMQAPVLPPCDPIVVQSVPNLEISDTLAPTEEALIRACSEARTLTVGTHIIDLSTVSNPPELREWYVQEEGALAAFEAFVEKDGLAEYHTRRDSLELDARESGGTSRMSLALTWGFVSARTLRERVVRDAAHPLARLDAVGKEGHLTFLSELMWREFYKYLLYHTPSLMHEEFQQKFRGSIQWQGDDEALRRFLAWIRGETGYDVVDAAMRQLSSTGWMHNRARMIVASVLTKNLGVDWRWGQEYFRATLVDLDEASNNGGWQWGASVGADPKPIRIFNPLLQAERHDATQEYRRHWLGEERLQNPPTPIVPHALARSEALKRYGLSSGDE